MTTLTVDEAVASLGKWVQLALAGERVQIRQGDAVVELRPAVVSPLSPSQEPLAPREALRRLQADAHLSSADAATYLREVCEERLAAEGRRPA